jgi:hypothetical protein
MKNFLRPGMVLVMGMATTVFASANVSSFSKPYVPATVLQVEKHEIGSPVYTGGGNPSDTPLRSEYYAYEVSVRVNCGTYVARYETPFDYIPSAFAPGHTVPVRITKHVLYFSVPDYQEMKMGIVHKPRDQQANCADSEQRK